MSLTHTLPLVTRMRIEGRLPYRKPADPVSRPLPVEGPTYFDEPPPFTAGYDSHHLWRDKRAPFQVMNHIVEVPNGIANRAGTVFDAAGRRIQTASHKWREDRAWGGWMLETSKSSGALRGAAATHVEGDVAVATSSNGSMYFHWMMDILPRIHLAKRICGAGVPVYVDASQPFMRETLARLNVENYIDASTAPLLTASRLIVPCHQILDGHAFPEWAIDAVRGLFLAPGSAEAQGQRRLYLSRRTAARRRIVNEDEVAAYLAELGFETVYPETLSIAEQAQLFSTASAVVGPSGGAFTNIVFCSPGCKVVNFFAASADSIFYRLSTALGLRYAYVSSREAPRESRHAADFALDMDGVRNTFASMGFAA